MNKYKYQNHPIPPSRDATLSLAGLLGCNTAVPIGANASCLKLCNDSLPYLLASQCKDAPSSMHKEREKITSIGGSRSGAHG